MPTFTYTRRIHAIVDETVTYVVSQEVLDELMAEEGCSIEAACDDAKANGTVERVSYNVEIDEVIMEHDHSIEVE